MVKEINSIGIPVPARPIARPIAPSQILNWPLKLNLYDKKFIEIKQSEYRRLKKRDPNKVNSYTARVGDRFFKEEEKERESNLLEEIENKFVEEEYLDEKFPKGDNRRGEVLALLGIIHAKVREVVKEYLEKNGKRT